MLTPWKLAKKLPVAAQIKLSALFVWNRRFHYPIDNSLAPGANRNQLTQVYTRIPYSVKTHLMLFSQLSVSL
jgi:hypothetical protein